MPISLTSKAISTTEECAMSSERDSFAKGIFSTFAKGFLLHKLLLKVNYSPLRVKKSRSHDMGQKGQKFDHKISSLIFSVFCLKQAQEI
jgi:hypothetical protein